MACAIVLNDYLSRPDMAIITLPTEAA